ncbi:hypothetical protein BDR03DRAFT_949426 [Suillus americanus]|nr:hypothetical protein BDR03DRAFT_949426 [Suillus americanus]
MCSCVCQISVLVHMFVLGPHLILSIREHNAKLSSWATGIHTWDTVKKVIRLCLRCQQPT